MAAMLRGAALTHRLPCVEKESDFHRDLDPLLLGLSDSSLRDALAMCYSWVHYCLEHPSVPSAAATPTKFGRSNSWRAALLFLHQKVKLLSAATRRAAAPRRSHGCAKEDAQVRANEASHR
jgi:hypothetical protein